MLQALEIEVARREIFGRPPDMSRPWGLFVQKDGFQGWGGLPAGRREALARAVQHGEHDVPTYLPSRIVTIDGWAIAPSPYELQHELEIVTATAGTGAREPFQATQWGIARRASCRRILATADDQGRWKGRHIYAPFQLQFVFPDPRKYGDTNLLPKEGTATSIPVFSMGEFPAFVEVVLPNPPGAYTVTSPGGVFTVDGATASGVHTVNLRTGRVYRNGIEMPGVGSGDLWAVPVGATWQHVLSVPGQVRITDTFI